MIASKEINIVSIKEIKINPKNRNKHSKEQIERLVEIIGYQGFRSPLIVSNRTGLVVAGHGRLQAAKKLKFKEVPVMYQDFENDEQEYACMVSDNAIASWSELDLSQINTDIQDLGPDFNIDLLGIKGFTIDVADKETFCDEDEVPEHVEPKTKLGDMYELGKHRLLCGDSTDPDVIAKLMAGTRADFCFTSPPYSDQREYNGGKELSPSHLAKFLMAPVKCFAVNLGMKRKDGRIDPYWNEYIAIAESLTLPLTSWNIWNRQGFGFSIGNATALFPIEHEFIFIFGTPDVTNCVVENKSAGRSDDYQTIRLKDGSTKERAGTTVKSHRPLGTVAHIGMEAERTIDHPAKFPVKLPETYIEACSKEGASIYEPFGGSGTSLIACEKTNRKCFMMELDPHYCDVIVARWEKYTGKKAELING